ncbi:MAG: hypothetical protein WC302_01455 [Candidatus Paceibacterota bacterium]
MSFSSTGISYLMISISLSILTFRLFQYWRDKRDLTSRLFAFFGIFLCSFLLVRALSGIFFLDNYDVLIFSVYIVVFLQTIATSIMGYLISYLLLPKISPWIISSLAFLFGLFVTYLSTKIGYVIDIREWGSISWNFRNSTLGLVFGILRSLLLAIAFVPMAVVMIQQGRKGEDKLMRRRSLGLGIILLGGMLIGFLDFIIVGFLNFNIIYRDITTCIMAVVILVVVILTQKPSKQYKERIE